MITLYFSEISILTVGNKNLNSFTNTFNLENLIKRPTYFKSSNSSYLDLIITNEKEFFMKSCTAEVGISDHYHLVAAILKNKFIKGNPKKQILSRL